MGKITIEKARDTLRKFMALPSLNITLSHIADYNVADGFVDGWESRQKEIDELKKEIANLKRGIGSHDVEKFYEEKTDERD